MHTAGDTGSQSTQLTGPSQPLTQNCRTGESSDRAMKTRGYQFSLQCKFMMEIWQCPLVCIIHPAWWCPLLAWVCNTDNQTWQLRWKPATCNSKPRTSIGSNHHSLVHWTNRCCFPDRNLCSSQQLALAHRASRPRMLSLWRQPCEG